MCVLGAMCAVFSCCFMCILFENGLQALCFCPYVLPLCFYIFLNQIRELNAVFVFWRVLKCVVWGLCVRFFLAVFMCILFVNNLQGMYFPSPMFFSVFLQFQQNCSPNFCDCQFCCVLTCGYIHIQGLLCVCFFSFVLLLHS